MWKIIQDLSQAYPLWAQSLMILLFVVLIAVAVFTRKPQTNAGEDDHILVERRQENASQLLETRHATPSPVRQAGNLGMTLEELDEKYRALDGRFSEQEALVRELNGRKIKWTVDVLSVGNCSPGICVTFLSTSGAQLRTTTAEFSEDFRQRLYALRQGDRITIEGALRADIYGNHWNVACTAFQLAPQGK